MLTAVLTYHVVPGTLTSADIKEKALPMGGRFMVKTVNGEDLTFRVDHETRLRRRCQGRCRPRHHPRRHAVERRDPRHRHRADALTPDAGRARARGGGSAGRVGKGRWPGAPPASVVDRPSGSHSQDRLEPVTDDEIDKEEKVANSVAMIMTMTVVSPVSRRVGQVIFATSARTCWMNCRGLVRAISLSLRRTAAPMTAARPLQAPPAAAPSGFSPAPVSNRPRG